MSNEQNHHEHESDPFFDSLFEGDQVNVAALIRACADGELCPDQCDRLKQLIESCPDLRSQAQGSMNFSKAMRSSCARSMTMSCCPESLRARVQTIVSEQPVSGHERAGVSTRDHRFWTRSPMLAIAAALLLSFAGVLIWQSSSLIGAFSGPNLTLDQASYSEQISSFALGEHTRCCEDEAAEAKLIERDIDQSVRYFSDAFDHPVEVPDLSRAGGIVEFFGGGDCHVPRTIRSGHLRFDATDEQGQHISLSLFIAPDPGILPLEEGTTYRLSSEACDKAGARVFVWVEQGVQYLLVSEASDKLCASLRSVMNAPTRLRQI